MGGRLVIGEIRQSTYLFNDILVEFSVNPDIAGGMVLRSTNRIYDMSFRSLLLNQPEGFTRTLENV